MVSTLSASELGPFRLKPMMVERVWGLHDLQPWYPVQSEKAIGEAWLTGDECSIETGPLAGQTLGEAWKSEPNKFPLLVKFLFPKDKLSVQVHPDDADAARLGNGAEAKTECWYVLQAEPGSAVALGLKPGADVNDVRAAIEDATLEHLLESVPVAAGDMVYVPAGTIHAIEPGVVILEIQQTSDTTYRLYDYGRPRELHLDKGLSVLKLKTDAGLAQARPIDGGAELIRVPHFTVERYEVDGERSFTPTHGVQMLIALSGDGVVRGAAGEVALQAGEAVVVPAGAFVVEGKATVVRCFVTALVR